MKKVLNKIIGTDQAGFLPGRLLCNNTRTILDIIEYAELNPGKKIAILLADAEKAFDRINWNFMAKVLEQVKLGDKIIKGIKAIYKNQRPKMIINNEITEELKITRGTRQGCPLSPLLFILVLEILLKPIKEDEGIEGVKINGQKYIIKAFADDIAAATENPEINVNLILDRMNEFGRVAGFKLNKEKSNLIVKKLTIAEQRDLEKRTGLKICNKAKYLEIWISNKNANREKTTSQDLRATGQA